MLRLALASVLLTVTLAAPLGAQANPSDPSGTWTVSGSLEGGLGSYAGEVTIARNGECYDVTWSLAGGVRYSGIGMLVAEYFAVAYGGDGSNGVVLYLPLSSTGFLAGFLGWWCGANGRMGIENLGPPGTIEGTHPLTGGNSGTGTVAFTQARDSDIMYTIQWETSQASYSGFGVRADPSLDLFAGSWGSQQGQVALYDLASLEDGRMYGGWASVQGLGVEELTRR